MGSRKGEHVRLNPVPASLPKPQSTLPTKRRHAAPLPPARPALPLHLELRVHQLGLHPRALLLVVSHAGPIEEVGQVGDRVGCDDCGDFWEGCFVFFV